jgi:hypothetical protein
MGLLCHCPPKSRVASEATTFFGSSQTSLAVSLNKTSSNTSVSSSRMATSMKQAQTKVLHGSCLVQAEKLSSSSY